jgi:hypothetical protein
VEREIPMPKQVEDILIAVESIKSKLKRARNNIERLDLIEDLLGLYICLEIEVKELF